MKITIERTLQPKRKPDSSNLGFGKTFSDHMFRMDYTLRDGWHHARIVPFGDLVLHPAATVLHYGSEIFEGLKAYRTAEGEVQLFRAIENVKRMNASADRLCLPGIPEEDMLEALRTFVDLERDWVPSAEGTSLYLRPFLYGCDSYLGVHTIETATFIIIASPSGAYYPEGIKPTRIMIETEDVRAVRGGTGFAKCGGNYAASARAQQRAEALGFTQVMWLDGVERKYIEEVGTSNVMFKIDGKVITPALNGSILSGITRMSSLQILRDKGFVVEERRISVEELKEAVQKGTLEEAWATGTAAVVSPIGVLSFEGEGYTINGNEIGKVAQDLYDTLTGIQWGVLPDPYGWTEKIETASNTI